MRKDDFKRRRENEDALRHFSIIRNISKALHNIMNGITKLSVSSPPLLTAAFSGSSINESSSSNESESESESETESNNDQVGGVEIINDADDDNRKPAAILDDDDDDDANEPTVARSASNTTVIATTMDGGNDSVNWNPNPKRHLSHMPNNSDPDRACSLKIRPIVVEKEVREIISVDDSDDDDDHDNDGLYIQKMSPLEQQQKSEAVAKKLQQEEDQKRLQLNIDEQKNKAFATLLQQEEDRASQKANPEIERNVMMKTNTGRAVLAVERIIQLVESMKFGVEEQNCLHELGMETVAKDDMVFLAERLLAKQEEFKVD